MVDKVPLVCVVDDEESVLVALRRLLRSAGLAVATFSCGQAFLDSLGSLTPDCVVLDVHMQGLSGLEVQRRLAERAIGVPIVFITAYADPETHQQAIRAGAAAFLAKPLHEDVLLQAIGAALGQPEGGWMN